MGGTGNKVAPPKQDEKSKQDGKSRKPQNRPDEDDVDDGDIATPKHDREGNDDEPL